MNCLDWSILDFPTFTQNAGRLFWSHVVLSKASLGTAFTCNADLPDLLCHAVSTVQASASIQVKYYTFL